MSRSIRSPIRMPASKRSATISVSASLKAKSQELFRILRGKARNSRAQKKIAGWRRRRDAQHAGRLAAEFIRRFQCRLILVKDRPKPLQKTLAGCSWGNRSCRPLDQAHAEAFLEVTDQLAHPR